jgi:hypothetical protein
LIGGQGDDGDDGGDGGDGDDGGDGGDGGDAVDNALAAVAGMQANQEREENGIYKETHVKYGGSLVHKGSFVASLNRYGKVSVDRLRRVQQQTKQAFNVKQSQWLVGLFDDIAIWFDDGNGGKTVWYGKVMRMRVRRKRTLFRHIDPVNIHAARGQTYIFNCNYYSEVKQQGTSSKRSQETMYKLDTCDTTDIELANIIIPVTMQAVPGEEGRFTVLPAQYEIIQQQLNGATHMSSSSSSPSSDEKRKKRKPSKRKKRKPSKKATRNKTSINIPSLSSNDDDEEEEGGEERGEEKRAPSCNDDDDDEEEEEGEEEIEEERASSVQPIGNITRRSGRQTTRPKFFDN